MTVRLYHGGRCVGVYHYFLEPVTVQGDGVTFTAPPFTVSYR